LIGDAHSHQIKNAADKLPAFICVLHLLGHPDTPKPYQQICYALGALLNHIANIHLLSGWRAPGFPGLIFQLRNDEHHVGPNALVAVGNLTQKLGKHGREFGITAAHLLYHTLLCLFRGQYFSHSGFHGITELSPAPKQKQNLVDTLYAIIIIIENADVTPNFIIIIAAVVIFITIIIITGGGGRSSSTSSICSFARASFGHHFSLDDYASSNAANFFRIAGEKERALTPITMVVLPANIANAKASVELSPLMSYAPLVQWRQ
jgi:hypothetical protein